MAPTSAITSPKVTQASVPMRFVGPMKISAQASFDAAWQDKVYTLSCHAASKLA